MRTKNGGGKGLYFIVLLILIALIAYSYNQNWFGLLSVKKEEISKVEDKKIEKPEVKEYKMVTKEMNDETNGVLIAAEYPNFGTKIDDKIKESIDAKITDFKNSISGSSLSDQFMNISFSATNYSTSIYSIRYDIVYGGGVHPVEDIDCKTYDLDNSKEIFLTDIFKKESEYLSKLSAVIYDSLLKDSSVDKDWAKEGTVAKADSFKNFTLEKNNIVFYFAPGVVAPNTAGVKKVEIPLSSLKYFLNNSFN